MRVEQVNTAQKTALTVGRREIQTGIFKTQQLGAVAVSKLGLQDDAICNTRHHGGPDQAVYLYSVEDYAFWGRQLRGEVQPATFGENLTTSGLDLTQLCVGDWLTSDTLTLQVAAPRIPCNTLATRMNDPHFARRFMQAGRSGAYCRVHTTGSVTAGDTFIHTPWEGDRMPLGEMFQDAHSPLSAEKLRRYLAVPIDLRTRADFEKKLAKAQ